MKLAFYRSRNLVIKSSFTTLNILSRYSDVDVENEDNISSLSQEYKNIEEEKEKDWSSTLNDRLNNAINVMRPETEIQNIQQVANSKHFFL